MDIDTLKAVAGDLFGNSWQNRMAKALGIDGSTIRRWIANGVAVPSYIEAYLHTLGERQEARGAVMYAQVACEPASFTSPEPVTLEHMLKRLQFPGVEQLKPMPAIHVARDDEGKRMVFLDGAEKDRVLYTNVDLTLVRHPDSRHLEGFLKAAKAQGHGIAVATHRFHHYSLLLSLPVGEPRLTHTIATHAGEIRTTTALASDPGTEISSGLGRILEFG